MSADYAASEGSRTVPDKPLAPPASGCVCAQSAWENNVVAAMMQQHWINFTRLLRTISVRAGSDKAPLEGFFASSPTGTVIDYATTPAALCGKSSQCRKIIRAGWAQNSGVRQFAA